MRSLICSSVLCLSLVACGGDKEDDDDAVVGVVEDLPADGIWLMRAVFNNDDSCTELFDHNFQDSYPLDDGPWTENEVLDYSDALGFVQISQLDADTAVMVNGTQVWPGTASGDGWTFAWDATDSIQYGKEHEEGYTYQEFMERTDSSSLSLSINGDEASGTWTFSSEEDITYKESDTWDSAVGLAVGDIPSADYLAYDDGDIEGLQRVNLAEDSDCDSAQCELRLNTKCGGTAVINLTRTGYDEEAAYDQLEGVAHPFGTGG